MNLQYYYWYFQSVIPPKICDDIIEYGKSQQEQIALTGDYKPDSVSKDDIKVILDDIADSDKYELTIDIQSQTINTPNDKVYSFDINPSDKERIILGYDDIGLTLKHSDKIKEYETKMKIKKPWMFEDNHE